MSMPASHFPRLRDRPRLTVRQRSARTRHITCPRQRYTGAPAPFALPKRALLPTHYSPHHTESGRPTQPSAELYPIDPAARPEPVEAAPFNTF